MVNVIVYFFNNIKLNKMKKDAKIVIKSLLFIIINCHIYVNILGNFVTFI